MKTNKTLRIVLETLACCLIGAALAAMLWWFPIWGHALASK